MRRISIALHQDEHDALVALADRERRDPRDQAAVLVRQGLERLRLVAASAGDKRGDCGQEVQR